MFFGEHFDFLNISMFIACDIDHLKHLLQIEWLVCVGFEILNDLIGQIFWGGGARSDGDLLFVEI